ncbi:MAG: DUF255 domain-containing protein, partial [Verrucomicrobiales bacterium]
MRLPPLFPILSGLVLFSACQPKEKEISAREEREQAVQEVTQALSQQTNELSPNTSAGLQRYADHSFPFQAWHPDLLTKAQEIECPILAIITSGVSPSAHSLLEEIIDDPEIAPKLSEHYLCTLVSAEEHPETALLAFYLSNEIDRPISFPFFAWLTPDGKPIAWLPIAPHKDRKNIKAMIRNSTAMVDDIWNNSREYAKNNSSINNRSRNERLTAFWEKRPEQGPDRLLSFQRAGREFISLYNPIEQNFDGAGGLLPSRYLSFTALIAGHPASSPATRERATKALEDSLHDIIHSPMHDLVNGGYFLLRRGKNWSIPVFVKTLASQSEFALSLYQAAATLNDPELMKQADQLLADIEKQFLGEPRRSIINPGPEADHSGLYLWSIDDLAALLSPDEMTLATELFELRKLGNIRLDSDSSREFFRLNSLPYVDPDTHPLLAEADKKALYKSILSKLRENYESELAQIFHETSIPAADFASLIRLYSSAARMSGRPELRERALELATEFRAQHFSAEGTFFRFQAARGIHARGIDYARTLLAYLDLYRLTLDPQWISRADELARLAIDQLDDGEGRLLELRPEDLVIPAPLSDHHMIFTDSSYALFENAFTQLGALTGDSRYLEKRQEIWAALSRDLLQGIITKTDTLQNTSFGDEPLLFLLNGPD